MNRDEEVARAWLVHQGFEEPEYEPGGPSTAPDFRIPGPIAVEVTRLSQVVRHRDGSERIDHAPPAIERAIRRTIDAASRTTDGPSWWIFVSFTRPIPPTRTTREVLQRALAALDESPAGGDEQTLATAPPLEVLATRRDGRGHPRLQLGSVLDIDEGGLVVANQINAIGEVIYGKRTQVTCIPDAYDQRWLVLVDHIGAGAGLDRLDHGELRRCFARPSWLDRLVIVDARDPRTFFDL